MMAEKSKETFKALEKLQDQITCPICLEIYSDPKVLPCLHTYCLKCLLKFQLGPKDHSSINCPNCRKEYTGDVETLQPAFFIDNFIEGYNTMKKALEVSEKITCDKCFDSEATGLCKECGEFLCNFCERAHQKLARHNIVVLANVEDTAKQSQETEVKDKYKASILSSLEPVKEQVETLESILANVNTLVSEVKEHGEKVKGNVEETTKKLQEALEERKLKVLAYTDKLVKEKVKVLSTQKEQLEKTQAQASSFFQSVHKRLESDDVDSTNMESTRAYVTKTNTEIMNSIDLLKKTPQKKAHFYFDFKESLMTDCLQYGKIITHYGELFRLSGVPSTILNKTTAIPITKTNNKRYINVKFAISVVAQGNLIPNVAKTLDNKILVEFQPHIRGANIVLVKANGENVIGSPYPVFVYTPSPTSIFTLQKPTMMLITEKAVITVGDSNPHVNIYSREWDKMKSFKLSGRNPQPRGVAIDNERCLLVTNKSNSSVTKYKLDGTVVKAVGKEGSSILQFSGSCGIAVSGTTGDIYVADQKNHRIQVLKSDLTFCHMFGTRGTGPSEFNQPRDIAVSDVGNLYVVDSGNNRIQVFTHNGNYIREFGNQGPKDSQLNLPEGVCIDRSHVLVSDSGNNRVCVFNAKGEFVVDIGKAGEGPGEFKCPCGITTDKDGVIYVADYFNNRVQMF